MQRPYQQFTTMAQYDMAILEEFKQYGAGRLRHLKGEGRRSWRFSRFTARESMGLFGQLQVTLQFETANDTAKANDQLQQYTQLVALENFPTLLSIQGTVINARSNSSVVRDEIAGVIAMLTGLAVDSVTSRIGMRH